MATKGWRKFDTMTAEDGTICTIRVHNETGIFRATVEGPKEDGYWARPILNDEDKDLEKLKERVEEFFRDNTSLEFRPVIVVREPGKLSSWEEGHSMLVSDERIALVYERYFIAKRKDGDLIWKEFRTGPEGKDAVKGEPGATIDRRGYVYACTIDYTPERWSALRLISRAIQSLNAKLRRELLGDDAQGFLESVARGGTAGLLAAPKESA